MIKIFARDKLRNGEWFEVTDMYFFEEEHAHDINDDFTYEFDVAEYCECGRRKSRGFCGICDNDE